MRFEHSDDQRALVERVDEIVAAARLGEGPWEVLARLGSARLLAVHYPECFGGRGLSLAHHVAIAERLGELGLPDVAHLITVQGVGCTILTFGTDEQKQRWLPEIAAGRLFASLLLSEAGAGSDLAGIETAAVADGTGWRISGAKAWSLHTDRSKVALCSVRTRSGVHRYDGISLFMVDLGAPGVEIVPTSRAAGTPYFTVTFDSVSVGADALIGPLDKGWALLPIAIGYERTGFDYVTRAALWLATSESQVCSLPEARRIDLAPDLVRLRAQVDAARALAYHAVNTAQGLEMDEVAAAYSKLACGRAAQAVASWIGAELLPEIAATSDEQTSCLLRAAVAEAPEFTISGGAQDLQLDIIAGEYPIGGVVR